MLHVDWLSVGGVLVTCHGERSVKFSSPVGLSSTSRNMAAVKDCKDTLCLFDVDGTVTPARLVSLTLRMVLFGGEGVHGNIVCEVVLCKKVCKQTTRTIIVGCYSRNERIHERAP